MPHKFVKKGPGHGPNALRTANAAKTLYTRFHAQVNPSPCADWDSQSTMTQWFWVQLAGDVIDTYLKVDEKELHLLALAKQQQK